MTLDTCQYYGDAVCGLTSRRYCIGSDEDATTYACRCMDGYDVVDGECQGKFGVIHILFIIIFIFIYLSIWRALFLVYFDERV